MEEELDENTAGDRLTGDEPDESESDAGRDDNIEDFPYFMDVF